MPLEMRYIYSFPKESPMYTLEDVDAAKARLEREAPLAKLGRSDYDWKLVASTPDRSKVFIVFDHNDHGWEILGDVDKIIAEFQKLTV
jgi:hypothetical protein